MKLGHVHLKVSDLKAAERFYCEIIGLKEQERVADAFLFLTFGESHHEIALQEISRDRQPISEPDRQDKPGLYHSAFEVDTPRELLEVIKRFDAKSVPFSLVDHKISWALYTEDPSGNGVEVYLDRRTSPGGRRVWGGASTRLSVDTITRAAAATL